MSYTLIQCCAFSVIEDHSLLFSVCLSSRQLHVFLTSFLSQLKDPINRKTFLDHSFCEKHHPFYSHQGFSSVLIPLYFLYRKWNLTLHIKLFYIRFVYCLSSPVECKLLESRDSFIQSCNPMPVIMPNTWQLLTKY